MDDHVPPVRIYTRACTRWTKAEEEQLLYLADQGMTVHEIAPTLGRLTSASDGRLRLLQRAKRRAKP